MCSKTALCSISVKFASTKHLLGIIGDKSSFQSSKRFIKSPTAEKGPPKNEEINLLIRLTEIKTVLK